MSLLWNWPLLQWERRGTSASFGAGDAPHHVVAAFRDWQAAAQPHHAVWPLLPWDERPLRTQPADL